MASPISRFIYDRVVAPVQAERQPAVVTKDTDAFAMGILPQPSASLRDTLGQHPDADYDLLYAIYKAHADVSACVAIWAGGVTGNGWHVGLMDSDAEPNRNQRKRIDEIETWLKNPNPTKRFSRILYELVAHMAITGDAYLNKVTDGQGTIRELWSVHPATVRIIADEHGMILGYIQRYHGVNVADFEPEEMSRFQLPSVMNDLYGHSPLESVLGEVHLDLHALRSNRAIFENGFKPSVIVTLKDGAKEGLERLGGMIRQKFTGAGNQHGVMVLGGVEDVKPYGQSLKEMEFTALRELTTEKVATAFRVPKFMLNLKGSHDLATSAVQERQFFNSTIKPVQDIIAEIFTEEILHAIDPDLAFYFNEPDFNDADRLRTDALKAEEQGIMDDDEVRERYFSMPKKTPEQRAEEEAQRQAVADQMKPPAEQPANNAKPGSDERPDDEAGTEASDAPTKKSVAKALSREEIEAIRDRRETIHDQLEEAIQPNVLAYFGRQETRYLAKLETVFKSQQPANDVQKAVIDTLIEPLFEGAEADDRDLSIQLFADLEPALAAGVAEAALQIVFTFDAEATRAIIDEYLLKNALNKARGINDTTKSQLSSTLRAGIGAGEGIPELRERVKHVFSVASNARANTIARTETAQALEYANERAIAESGVVSRIQWLTAKDDRVRESHRLLEGSIVRLGEQFASTDGPISPGEPINCRCTAIGIVDKDA